MKTIKHRQISVDCSLAGIIFNNENVPKLIFRKHFSEKLYYIDFENYDSFKMYLQEYMNIYDEDTIKQYFNDEDLKVKVFDDAIKFACQDTPSIFHASFIAVNGTLVELTGR